MSMPDINSTTITGGFRDGRNLRQRVMRELYQTQPNNPANQNRRDQILSDLTESFNRFAGNQQTAFDQSGPTSSVGMEASSMTRKVERAIAQVLGRAPGRSPESFVNVLNGAFPVSADGRQITFTPTRSVVSLQNPATGAAGVGQLSAQQANLYRQSSLIVGDAIKILSGLQPFAPFADQEQVNAIRNLMQTNLRSLLEEFGRVEEPRPARVETQLSALERHLGYLGRRSFLNDGATPINVGEESQVAGFDLISNYIRQIRSIWQEYLNLSNNPNQFSLSQRVERASLLLPIIAQSNREFEAALNSVGFLETERHSVALKFTQLAEFVIASPPTLRLAQQGLTVFDLNDWLDGYANQEGMVALTDSGQYGLDFVTSQAEDLFFVIAPVIGHLRTNNTAGTTSRARLEQVLSNERVIWSLDNLLNQLNGLADLAAPGGSPLA